MEIKDEFTQLLECLKLQTIQPLEMHSKRVGDPEVAPVYTYTISQAFGTDDPTIREDQKIIFHVKYDFTCKSGEQNVYLHTAAFVLLFEVTDTDSFTELWKNVTLQKVFQEQQIYRTLWPFLRQQINDGMSRLGIPPVTLPWKM